ncbi:hypothetical protein F5X99DRAFT_424971 [Biscogniauxia marginata]|nr:hypothetical protein F5X99DRAFT_424971 [Biscogniauxia marginata]
MSHSPLLRTVMRSVLDRRSDSLASYEIDMETACLDLHRLPNPRTFDTDGWTECRKTYESKKMRDEQRDESQRLFIKSFNQETKQWRTREKSPWLFKMRAMFKGVLPARDMQIKLAVARSGFLEWRPRTVTDSLQAEDSFLHCVPSYGMVDIGEQGVIEWNSLHSYISPRFVPKPHFYHERKRLQAKCAEFADFVAAQAKAKPPKRIEIPRPEDDTSDGGCRSDEDSLSDEDEEVVTTKKGGATKRKRGTKNKPKKQPAKKRARKPARTTKMFDSVVHDKQQLYAQTRNRFCLMQQRVPRAEIPAFELIWRKARELRKRREMKSVAMDVDAPEETEEERARRLLAINGIVIPVDLSACEEDPEEEEKELTMDEARAYRRWKKGAARSFFEERDAYMRIRVYQERVPDRELIRSAQRLVAFWQARKA